jgi:hypothetical protein
MMAAWRGVAHDDRRHAPRHDGMMDTRVLGSLGGVAMLAGLVVSGCLTKDNPYWGTNGADESGSDSGSATTQGTASTTAVSTGGSGSGTNSASSSTSSSSTTSASSTTAASTGSTGDTGTQTTGVTPSTLCDADDVDLVACWDFVGADLGTVDDLSMYGNHATAVNVTVEASPLGQALRVGDASAVTAPDSPSLDTSPTFTIEAWVLLDSVPSASPFGIFDNEGQYSLTVFDNGYRCNASNPIVTDIVPTTGVWTHVACVHDGSSLTVYVDGVVTASIGCTPPGTANIEPIAIGDNVPNFDLPLDGLLDALRVWRIPRSPEQICAASGNPACSKTSTSPADAGVSVSPMFSVFP